MGVFVYGDKYRYLPNVSASIETAIAFGENVYLIALTQDGVVYRVVVVGGVATWTLPTSNLPSGMRAFAAAKIG